MKQRTWLRITAEGAAIVASILVALAIDAWWERVQLRDAEQQTIAQLAGEFRTVGAALRGAEAALTGDGDTVLGDIGEMRELLAAMGTELATARLDSLLWLSLGNQRLRLPNGVLASTIASGQLSILRSDSLRAALGGWAYHAETLQEDRKRLTDFINDRLTPYLDERVSVRSLDTKMGYHEDLGPGPFARDPRPLLRDPVFENLINHRLINLETNLERIREASDHAALVARLLDEDVAQGGC